MSSSIPPPQWPVQPPAGGPGRSIADELLMLRRDPARGKLTGLSIALADYWAVDVLLVRALFALLAITCGLGVALYFVGWTVTADAQTGKAPLDRLGTSWRAHGSRTVFGAGLLLSLIVAAAFGGWVGAAWLTPGIVAFTAWLGWRSRHGLMQPAKPPAVRPLPARSAPRTNRRSTAPIAVLSLCLAGLAAGTAHELSGSQLWPALVASLFVIGCGLVAAAFRGRSILLVSSGIMVGLALTMTLAPIPTGSSEHYYFDSTEALTNQHFINQDVTLDLTRLLLEADHVWRIEAQDSSVLIHLPQDQRIDVDVDYASSLLGLSPGMELVAGNGHLARSFAGPQDAYTLTIIVDAADSQVWLAEP